VVSKLLDVATCDAASRLAAITSVTHLNILIAGAGYAPQRSLIQGPRSNPLERDPIMRNKKNVLKTHIQ
jgi:hypothetical protein